MNGSSGIIRSICTHPVIELLSVLGQLSLDLLQFLSFVGRVLFKRAQDCLSIVLTPLHDGIRLNFHFLSLKIVRRVACQIADSCSKIASYRLDTLQNVATQPHAQS